MLCGGTSGEKPADEEAKVILDSVKNELLSKVGEEGELKIHTYRTQVVAGTNYFMKISVGNIFIHARIHEPLPHTNQPPSLHSIQRGDETTETSSLEYF